MAFAILRVNKLKSAGAAGGLSAHIERTMDVPNADLELRHFNKRVIGSGDLWNDIKSKLEENDIKEVRKNGVYALEFLMTASPEHFNFHKIKNEDDSPGLRGNVKNWNQFAKKSLEWLKNEFGEENVVNFTTHLDEETPHIHAVVVPLVDSNKSVSREVKLKDAFGKTIGTHTKQIPLKKLSAKHFIDGRDKMRALQDTFATAHEESGLKRGIEGSKATHTTVKEFYSGLNQQKSTFEEINLSIPKPDLDKYRQQLPEPSMSDRMNPQKYAEKQINAILDKIKPDFDTMVEKVDKVVLNQKRKLSTEFIDSMKSRGDKKESLAQKRLDKLESIIEQKFNLRMKWDFGQDSGSLFDLTQKSKNQHQETTKKVSRGRGI